MELKWLGVLGRLNNKKRFMDDAQIERVKQVLMKYCNPKKEFDGMSPRDVVVEIIKAVEGTN